MDIKVDDLIKKLEKFKGGKVERVIINDINLSLDINGVADIDIDSAWCDCTNECKNDIQISIQGFRR